MTISEARDGANFRTVTPEEVAHYQKCGWVKLEKFVPVERIEQILAIARERMGETGDKKAKSKAFSYFIPEQPNGINNPVMRPVIEHFGRNARVLAARKAPVGIRFFADVFATKLPSGKPSRFGGNGASGFHQDYPASASDRSGGMVFWVPLTDMKPEAGTLSFVNGSHRFGVMGHPNVTYEEGNLLDSYPELLDHCTVTEPMSYAAGDVTVHSNLCVHGAGLNLTDDPRWTYLVIVNPADARWDGGPADAFDTTGLELHKEFDGERFPLIG